MIISDSSVKKVARRMSKRGKGVEIMNIVVILLTIQQVIVKSVLQLSQFANGFLIEKNCELSDFSINYPIGGETIQRTISIQWLVFIDSMDHSINYSIDYYYPQLHISRNIKQIDISRVDLPA